MKKTEITDDERQEETIDGYPRETNVGDWRRRVNRLIAGLTDSRQEEGGQDSMTPNILNFFLSKGPGD